MMTDKETQLSQIRQKQKEQSQGRIQKDSSDRFKKIIRKKLTTCFIFSLSEFENVFGQEVWGHGLPEEGLTIKQKANKKRWEQVRKNILNKGNTQARALEAETDLHSVEFQGYWTTFGGDNSNVK